MKNIFSVFAAVMLIVSNLFVNAQPGNEDWGSDKFIDFNSEKCVVSVAENGWIYVLHQYGTTLTSAENGWKLYVSEDGGWSFDLEMEQSWDAADFKLKDVDMVVAGDDPSNIEVYIADLRNTGTSGLLDGSMTIRRYVPGQMQLIYQKFYGQDLAYYLSMACDSRSPGGDCTPYCVSVAWTGSNTDIQTDELNYVYASDGGNTFHYESLYAFPGINRVSLSLGRSINQDLGYYAVAFEINHDVGTGLGDIGLLINHVANIYTNWTEPLVVNNKHSFLVGKVSHPAVCMMSNMYNAVGGWYVPIVIAMEDHSNASNSDLVIARCSEDFQWTGSMPVNPTLDKIVIAYPFGSNSPLQEKNPNMVFDKTFNNFLMTFSTETTEELYYVGTNVDVLVNDDWWNMGNYRSNTGDLPTNPLPCVDIDLSKGQAVFAWKDNYLGIASPAKSYVDAEWWVVGTSEQTLEQEINVYPNPVQDKLHICLDNKSSFTFSICNISGQVVLEGMIESDEVEIAIPDNLNHGIYLLNIKAEGQSFSKKLVVQ